MSSASHVPLHSDFPSKKKYESGEHSSLARYPLLVQWWGIYVGCWSWRCRECESAILLNRILQCIECDCRKEPPQVTPTKYVRWLDIRHSGDGESGPCPCADQDIIVQHSTAKQELLAIIYTISQHQSTESIMDPLNDTPGDNQEVAQVSSI